MPNIFYILTQRKPEEVRKILFEHNFRNPWLAPDTFFNDCYVLLRNARDPEISKQSGLTLPFTINPSFDKSDHLKIAYLCADQGLCLPEATLEIASYTLDELLEAPTSKATIALRIIEPYAVYGILHSRFEQEYLIGIRSGKPVKMPGRDKAA